MANPNSQTSTPLQNLSCNQAIRLLAKIKGLNVFAAATETAVPVIAATTWSVKDVVFSNGSAAMSIAAVGVFTGPGSTGTAILASTLLTTMTTAATNIQDVAPSTTAMQTAQTLYIRNITAAAAAATVDVFVYGYDLDTGTGSA